MSCVPVEGEWMREKGERENFKAKKEEIKVLEKF